MVANLFDKSFFRDYHVTMTPKDVLRVYGSPREAAEALGVTPQIVTYWARQKRIPYKTQVYIESKSGGRLMANKRAECRTQ